jgi:hypothetical protein
VLARYSRQPWFVVQCSTCGFVYLRNPPTYEQLVSEFAWEKRGRSKSSAASAKALYSKRSTRDAMENRASRRLTRASIQANLSARLGCSM